MYEGIRLVVTGGDVSIYCNECEDYITNEYLDGTVTQLVLLVDEHLQADTRHIEKELASAYPVVDEFDKG